MSTPEERAATIRERLIADWAKSLDDEGNYSLSTGTLGMLADDAMFHIEHLLAELEDERERARGRTADAHDQR